MIILLIGEIRISGIIKKVESDEGVGEKNSDFFVPVYPKVIDHF